MGGDVIPAGMKRWDGGDAAPADWDGGPVMLREGEMWFRKVAWWHAGSGAHGANRDVIAYTPKTDAKPDDGDRDAALVEVMARAIGKSLWGRDTMSPNLAAAAIAALAAYRAHQEAF